MGEETEKCASKNSRTQSHRKETQRNRGSKRLGRERYQESETWKGKIRVETRTSGL